LSAKNVRTVNGAATGYELSCDRLALAPYAALQ
jgi:hypothetical protein